MAKEAPAFDAGPARVVLEDEARHAAIHGLVRALEEAADRVFVLAVDLPALPPALIRAIAARSLASEAAAVLPRAGGRIQPLAGSLAALGAADRAASHRGGRPLPPRTG